MTLFVEFVPGDSPCSIMVKTLDFEMLGIQGSESTPCSTKSEWLIVGDRQDPSENLTRSCTRHLGAACYAMIHQ